MALIKCYTGVVAATTQPRPDHGDVTTRTVPTVAACEPFLDPEGWSKSAGVAEGSVTYLDYDSGEYNWWFIYLMVYGSYN